MRQSQAWKELERAVAAALGGRRNMRGGDFSISSPDVEHQRYSIECKYRSFLPQVITKAYRQAVGYAKPGQIPVVAIKGKHQKGYFVVIAIEDFIRMEEEA